MKRFVITNLYNMYNYGEIMQLVPLCRDIRDCEINIFSLYSIIDKDKCEELGIRYVGDVAPSGKIKVIRNSIILLLQSILIKLGVIKPKGILKVIKDSDLVIDMGGDTFSDYPSIMYSLVHMVSLYIAVLLNKKYVILSQSVGRFSNIITKRLAKYVLNKAAYITVREHRTFEYLTKEVGISPQIVKPVPEIGYLYDSGNNKSAVYKNNAVGILTSSLCKKQGGVDNEENIELLSYIGNYYRGLGYSILLIPHVLCPLSQNIGVNKDINDYRVAETLCQSIPGSRIISCEDMGSADIVIGSRLHGCIKAFNNGIPVVALAYSDKFFALEGNARIINIREALNDLDGLIKACDSMLGRSE